MTIGLFLIATGKYDVFLQPYIDSLRKHFFVNDRVIIYLFWDKPTYRLLLPSRFSLVCVPAPHKPFPYPTLLRYQYFCSVADQITTDFVFYSDVDMRMVGDVGHEILPTPEENGIVATRHPGFYINGGGAWCSDERSKAFTLEANRNAYFAGGFNGGITKNYMEMCKELSADIENDLQRSVIATWHDESHLNRYLSVRHHKVLSPEYCMIEEIDQREVYGINHMNPKLIALKKDHEKIRLCEDMPEEKNDEELTEQEKHDLRREEWIRNGNA